LTVLRELLLTLVEARPRWAVFVTRNDDEAQGGGENIERRYQAVEGLAEAVGQALGRGDAAVCGLCFLPTAAEKKGAGR
jgi:hypothetical protein